MFLTHQVFSQSVSVDFSTAQIGPPTLPGYSGTIIVDSRHKIHLLCADINYSSITPAPCQIVNGTLFLEKATWSPFLTYSTTLYFDPPATSVSGITSGEIGSSVLFSFNQVALYADNTQIFFKQNPPPLFSYPFSYAAPSRINFLSLKGLFPQTAGATIGDPNAYYYLGLNSITWTTQANNLDLSLGEISISPATVELDNQLSVNPDKELQIQVPITGTGISSTENRVAPVYIVIGSKYYQQNVTLSELASGRKTLSFTVTIPIDEVGDKTIYAVVDPANTLNEAQRLNNISSRFVHILCHVSDKGADVPWFYQSQTPWGSDDYANLAPKKMKNLGCLVTSFSMMLNAYGIKMSSHNTNLDPGALNQGLKETLFPELGSKYSSYNGYSLKGDVQPNGLVAYARNAYFLECAKNTGNIDSCLAESKRRISFKGSSNVFNETTRSLINKELCQGNPVILRVPSISQPSKSSLRLSNGNDS